MKDTDFLALSTWVRVMENRLLTRERRERMIEAGSDEEAVKILSECGYAEPEDLSPNAVNAVLAQAREGLFRELKAHISVPAVVEVFQIKYDYHNAKALIKAEAVGEDARRLMMKGGRYDIQVLADEFHKGDLSQYSKVFQAAVQEAIALLAQTHDPQKADLLLDKACYAEMAQAATESESKFLQGYVRLSIDTVNLRLLVRCSRMRVSEALLAGSLLPGGSLDPQTILNAGTEAWPALFKNTPLAGAARLGETLSAPGSGSLTPFERACDNVLIRYLSDAKRIPFGEQPIIGYLCAREAEATAIRTILAGRKAGESVEAIRERLRECYV